MLVVLLKVTCFVICKCDLILKTKKLMMFHFFCLNNFVEYHSILINWGIFVLRYKQNFFVFGFSVRNCKRWGGSYECWVAARAAQPGMGISTLVPGCSIHLSSCSSVSHGKHPANPGPSDWRSRFDACDMSEQALCIVLIQAAVIRHRAAWQITPNSFDYMIPITYSLFFFTSWPSFLLCFRFPFSTPVSSQVNNSPIIIFFHGGPSFAASLPRFAIYDTIT